ncbi:RluA family pseudouridine synthase [Gemella sp. zg-570]|uniref:RluA family pseudouridine synthase n=1 Tax=unclassified Gemella TaxID=2624949 RepID=UPI001C044B35|nr:RluA family pseudouridine synthase [Gemella sp. zg-570]MBU0278894.1 RluA family pseudouridine synthase [Gemella sp. zg-1178]QWQ38589.1 RluA family pseudouridine synthase [Gemella sp. zg-570]
MNNLTLRYVVKKEEILRDFLLSKNISKKTLIRIKFDKDGSIKVNNKEENVRYKLLLGDVVEITLPSESFSSHIRYFFDKINILYEDEYILIVEKGADLPTIPSRNSSDKSLLEQINGYFVKNNFSTIPHIVTRLDKNTSGLVLIAKHRHIHSLLSKIDIDKYYLALLHGNSPKELIIEKNIACASNSIIERIISPDGEYAKTSLERLAYNEKFDFTLVKFKLYTGRTHQIRVHSKSIGHSLLGDELYGGKKDLIKRQALHCHNLIFNHPITNKKINIKSELTYDMACLIKNVK